MAGASTSQVPGNKKEQPYERLYGARKQDVTSVYTSSRTPNVGDARTGNEIVEFVIKRQLPVKHPVPPQSYGGWDSLTPREQSEKQKIFQDKQKAFSYKTEKNNGDGNLGNLDSDRALSEGFKIFTSAAVCDSTGDRTENSH